MKLEQNVRKIKNSGRYASVGTEVSTLAEKFTAYLHTAAQLNV